MKNKHRFMDTRVFKTDKKPSCKDCEKCTLDKLFRCKAGRTEEDLPNRQIDTLARR